MPFIQSPEEQNLRLFMFINLTPLFLTISINGASIDNGKIIVSVDNLESKPQCLTGNLAHLG